jgi:hypothetical protein
MRKSRLLGAVCACVFILLCNLNSATAAVVYNESINGDLSFSGGGPAGPKLIGLNLGSNEIIGSVQDDNDVFDPFAFLIPQGQVLESVVLLDATYSTALSFFDGLDATASNYIGGTFGLAQDLIGQDLLALSGLTSLPAGPYSARFFGSLEQFQEYHIDMVVSQVPLPATAWLFGSGLLGLIGMARKKTA